MLTALQARVLHFVAAYTAQHGGVSPSFAEIAEHAALRSKGTVYQIVAALAERGFIRRRKGRARAIEVIRKPGERTDYALKYAADGELMAEVFHRWPDLRARLGIADTDAVASGARGDAGPSRAGAGDFEKGATARQLCQERGENVADVMHLKLPPFVQGQPASGEFPDVEKLGRAPENVRQS